MVDSTKESRRHIGNHCPLTGRHTGSDLSTPVFLGDATSLLLINNITYVFFSLVLFVSLFFFFLFVSFFFCELRGRERGGWIKRVEMGRKRKNKQFCVQEFSAEIEFHELTQQGSNLDEL